MCIRDRVLPCQWTVTLFQHPPTPHSYCHRRSHQRQLTPYKAPRCCTLVREPRGAAAGGPSAPSPTDAKGSARTPRASCFREVPGGAPDDRKRWHSRERARAKPGPLTLSWHRREARAPISSFDTHVRGGDGCWDRGQGGGLRRHVCVPVLRRISAGAAGAQVLALQLQPVSSRMCRARTLQVCRGVPDV